MQVVSFVSMIFYQERLKNLKYVLHFGMFYYFYSGFDI